MLKIRKLKKLSKKEYERITNRSSLEDAKTLSIVKKIIADVRNNGDKALLNAGRKWSGGKKYGSIRVTREEIKNAYREVDNKFINSIKQMIKNITIVHKAQLPKKIDTKVKPENGIEVWREWRAIERVGLYIPGGKATYPSSVLMSVIPAKIAGSREIVICSPAKLDGKIPAQTLVAADMVGVKKIYKVGGAGAVAAMAYGTKTVPKVYKIFGAGNSYVAAAKMLVQGKVAIDMPAGPSEVLIIADETANPSFIASDLLADGEHGEDSACVMLATSISIARRTTKEIEKQLLGLPTAERIKKSFKKYGLIAVVDSVDEAIEFSNEYAPEHIEIMTKNADDVVKKIANAGSVFVGSYTAKAAGDYAIGANHVLPTGKSAKMYPPLGVDSFGKWMQVQSCTKEGLINIRNTVVCIAEVEQLPAHKKSVKIRFED